MIAVIQRVTKARVTIGGEEVGRIGRGLVVLLGVAKGDGEKQAKELAEKVVKMRIFGDDQGKMNKSIGEVGGEILVVSQFTLLADTKAGRRPSFSAAAEPETARRLYELFIENVKIIGIPTQSGKFGAIMEVELINDGPVTIIVRS
jgi:D-tyrosyl-tRNA(Tyr) deacylase